jgi:hypothetical protein
MRPAPSSPTPWLSLAMTMKGEDEMDEQTTYGDRVIEAMAEALVADDWHFEREPNSPIIRMYVRTKGGVLRVTAYVPKGRLLLALSATLHTNVPEERRRDVAVLLTRLNDGVIVGGYQMDMSDGEVRYSIGQILDETAIPNRALLLRLVYLAVQMMEKGTAEIMQTIYASPEPKVSQAKILQIASGSDLEN